MSDGIGEERAPSDRPTPSGTVTFLFTDIEGSTQRWERDRSAMQAAVRKHDQLVRAAIESQGGVVFKTVGDAFYAVFELAPRAARAALEVQSTIQNANFEDVGGLAVRIALHTGNADERGGDYFGPALNRVARLLSIGHGGQTLLSSVTAGLIDGQLPEGSALDDRGMHRLKDLERPEHVHQLNARGARHDFPPLKSLDAFPNNLPLQMTSFVERDRDIAEITSLLEEHRVVTLVGSGGVGKTRISLQVGANLVDHNDDGVWFVEFASVNDAALVPGTIASTIGLTLPAGADQIAALLAPVKSKRMLLILDNCEHLVAAVSEVAAAIVRGCPKVSILASSRQALGIAGEATYRIPSLLVPNAPDAASLRVEDVPKYGALSLFVARAQTADSRFKVTDENAPDIADICRRLDGIALAIELAAARAKMLSLRDLRDRLNERFRVLTGGSRDVLPRQQTLRAAIDWSFDLLSDTERQLLIRVGIFADTFSLEAANAVCNFETSDELELLETLSSLVDKSLIVAELDGPVSRYRLLETTRAYAREKLVAANQLEQMADRHLEYFRELSEREFEAFMRVGPGSVKSLVSELEDTRAAIEWSLQSDQAAAGASVLAVMNSCLDPQEFVGKAETFLRLLPDDAHRLRSELWGRIGWTEAVHGNRQRFPEATEKSLQYARLANNDAFLADALSRRALVMFCDEHRAEGAENLLREAEMLAGDFPPTRYGVIWARVDIAKRTPETLNSAVSLGEELRAIARSLENYSIGEGFALDFSSEIEFKLGNIDRAIEQSRLALSIAEQSGHAHSKHLLSSVLNNLASYLINNNDTAGAKAVACQSLAAATSWSDAKIIWATPFWAVETIAFALALEGDWNAVAVLTGWVDANVSPNVEPDERWAGKSASFLELLNGHFTPDELAAQLAQGANLKRRETIALAMEAANPLDRLR